MKKFIINPYVGVNDVRFGMRRSEVHGLLGIPVKSKRNRHSHQLVDYWNDNSLQLAFSQDAEDLEEILMFDRLEDVELIGLQIFKQPRRQVMDALVAMDGSVVEEVGIYTFPALGIAISGFLDEGDKRSVTAFKKGLGNS